jgi:hypothetical protein
VLYYSDDEAIYPTNRILQPLDNMSLKNIHNKEKLVQGETDESEEYR